MRYLRLALLAAACLPCFTRGETAPAAYPPHAIANSQLRVLPKSPTGRQYQLHIGLPGSYARSPDRKYPVVYVTDGYWDFQKITAIAGTLVYDRVVPEFIAVGIGYPGENLDYGALRAWELSPVPFGDNPAQSGHAADFLRTLEHEIIPFVEREYRADPAYRVMGGASLGGLFTLGVMYHRPELFKAYIAATPAVAMAGEWMKQIDEKFAATKKPLPVRLFVAGGGDEYPGFLRGIHAFDELMKRRKYEGLAYQFRLIDGERHAGMQNEAYTRGLRWAFAPLAPESGPANW